MKLYRKTVSLPILFSFFLCCNWAFSQEILSNDAEAIRITRLEQNLAMENGDLGRASSFWTEDVTLRRGLGAALSGRDAYLATLESNPNILFVREPEFIEVSSHWPLAYESGTWTAKNGQQEIIAGRYSAQWVKREENWFIRSEVFVALSCNDPTCTWTAQP